MATWRRRSKSGGITYTSTNKGWTTSTSSGAGKRGGSGYRVTTTRKADGKTIIRRTERGGQGWYKTTQKTLSSKDPFKLTQRDLNKIINGNGSSGGSLIGDTIDLIVDIVNIFKERKQYQENIKESNQEDVKEPKTTQNELYDYQLQWAYKDHKNTDRWYNCTGSLDRSKSLPSIKERLQFKTQGGDTAVLYRIVKIDKDGWTEPL